MDNVVRRNEDLQGMLDNMNDVNESIAKNKAEFKSDLANDVINLKTKVNEDERNRQNRVDNRNNWVGDLQNKINGALDIGKDITGGTSIPVEATGGKLDKSGEVKISDEDLKYLKDFAEQEFVNKFTSATLAPNISIQFGDVHENADAESIKNRIQEILEEEIAEVAEGVYE